MRTWFSPPVTGTVVKAPIDTDTFYKDGGGLSAETMTATTLGEENRKSIEAAYDSYIALSDEQKIALENIDGLESALNLIGKSLCGAITLGDANSDGEINLKDANRIIQYCANWDVEINLTNADINCDGKVNLKDVNKIIRLSAGYED